MNWTARGACSTRRWTLASWTVRSGSPARNCPTNSIRRISDLLRRFADMNAIDRHSPVLLRGPFERRCRALAPAWWKEERLASARPRFASRTGFNHERHEYAARRTPWAQAFDASRLGCSGPKSPTSGPHGDDLSVGFALSCYPKGASPGVGGRICRVGGGQAGPSHPLSAGPAVRPAPPLIPEYPTSPEVWRRTAPDPARA
jgi:hypothetical protein